MRLKHDLFIIIGLLFCINIFSQNTVEQLKQFYSNADMDCYIDKIQNNVNEYFALVNKTWASDKYNIPPQKVELNKDEIVPMLTIQFINIDTFNLNDNIYNFITIDSSIVFTFACVDNKMNVNAFVHFFDGVNGYYEIDKDPSIKNIIERIKFSFL